MGNSCPPGCGLWCLYWCLFVLSFFPRNVLDEIWDLIGSVSEGFPTYFWETHACGSYICYMRQYYSDWDSHFCFCLGESKFHHVVYFSATILPGENPLWRGKNGYAETRIVDFPGKQSYIRGEILLHTVIFFRWEIPLWKNHSHFSDGKLLHRKK